MKKTISSLLLFSGIIGAGLLPALAIAQTASLHVKLVSGTASAVSASSFTLTRGAKTYTINVPSAATVVNDDWQDIALTSINTGDRVSVFGKINGAIIDAIYVRDKSIPPGMDTKEMSGTASNITANSFVLNFGNKNGNKTSTININSHAMLFDKNWSNINLADIKEGHRVKVFGRTTDKGATMNAIYVIDKALPVQTQ